MNTCIIGIGSNIEPEKNIRAAISLIGDEHELVLVSNLIITSPLGIKDQPDFLNGAARIRTSFSEEEFVKYLKNVEDRLGRDRSKPKYGPRTIDLDVVIWNNRIVDQDYYERDYLRVLVSEVQE